MATSKVVVALLRTVNDFPAVSAGARSVIGALSEAVNGAASSLRVPPPQLELAGFGDKGWFLQRRAGDAAAEEADDSGKGSWWKRLTSLEVFNQSIWFAVPKRKSSYARKRSRQLNPLYASHDITHFYPCPKCTKGLMKLRHHVCPCDQEKMNFLGVKKITYHAMKKADPSPAAPASPSGEPVPSRSTS